MNPAETDRHHSCGKGKEHATPVRYGDAFESMYILAKGRPKTVHILKDKPNKWAGTKTWGGLTRREVDGTLTPKGRKTIQKFGARTNVWHYGTVLPMESELFGGKTVSLSERLAEDHIRTWSNEGDLVLAPFDKDGAVAKIAPLLARHWLSVQNTADCDGLRDNAG
ncbi:DNA methyltransferase [Dysosmobacter sp.]|uniref:DNA methyltransferase n=1 Tax=Dysosmobacter sp. TaxID=2591382 RepID=UPI00307B5A6A